MGVSPLDIIRKTDWVKWGTRRITLRLAENWALSTLHFRKLFGCHFPDQLFVIEDEIGIGYLNRNQLDSFLEDVVTKIYRFSFEEFYEKRALRQFHRFLDYVKKISQMPLSRFSDEKLSSLFSDFLREEDHFTPWLWIIFLLDEKLTRLLETELRKHLTRLKKKEGIDQYINVIFSPGQKSAVFLQALDVFDVAARFKNKTLNLADLRHESKLLAEKYSYFPILNFDEEPLGFSFFYNEIKKVLSDNNINPHKEIDRINKNFVTMKKDYRILVKSLAKNKRLCVLINACHKIAYYRDHRNDIRRESYFYARALYKEIAHRLDIDLTSLLYLTREEIKISLSKKRPAVQKQTILQRKNYFPKFPIF